MLVSAILLRQRCRSGAVCCAYPAGRLILETFREPQGGSTRFTVHHAVSAVIRVLALATLTGEVAAIRME
jgi:prolipoprotein diacylglyceryltransferase